MISNEMVSLSSSYTRLTEIRVLVATPLKPAAGSLGCTRMEFIIATRISGSRRLISSAASSDKISLFPHPVQLTPRREPEPLPRAVNWVLPAVTEMMLESVEE